MTAVTWSHFDQGVLKVVFFFFFEQMLKIQQNQISAHLHWMGSKVLPGSEEITLNTSEEPSMENQRFSSRKVTAEAMPRLLFRTSLPSAWRGTCIKVPQPLGAGTGLKQGQGDVAGCHKPRKGSTKSIGYEKEL